MLPAFSFVHLTGGTMQVKTLSIGQILTPAEMTKAIRLYKHCESYQFAKRCADEIISPVLDRINKISGQENDPKYLAYCIEYAILKSNGELQ
jgi:hypothetical protein